jgi:hypothetical protein
MNEKQQNWTKTQCNILKNYLDSILVLSDKHADAVAGYIAVVSKVAKGCESEVRSALFDVVEPYQRKAEEMMRNEG